MALGGSWECGWAGLGSWVDVWEGVLWFSGERFLTGWVFCLTEI
jgi:hypothetical protein